MYHLAYEPADREESPQKQLYKDTHLRQLSQARPRCGIYYLSDLSFHLIPPEFTDGKIFSLTWKTNRLWENRNLFRCRIIPIFKSMSSRHNIHDRLYII